MTPAKTDQLWGMERLAQFFSPEIPSLKICGVTDPTEAQKLATAGVPALGLNFWPKSKRYCSPDEAYTFAPDLAQSILRVGVFVNNARDSALWLFKNQVIDVVQLHGDESDEEFAAFLAAQIPAIRSLSLPSEDEFESVIAQYRELGAPYSTPFALLLDAHAPGVYGGTGQTIDWEGAQKFIALAHPIPVLLAGGITPDNAAQALAQTRPAGLDIASGAEVSAGRKDFQKVAALLLATSSQLDENPTVA